MPNWSSSSGRMTVAQHAIRLATVHRDDRAVENRLHIAAQRNQFQHPGNRQPPRAARAGKGQHARQIQTARSSAAESRQTRRQQQPRQQQRVRVHIRMRVDQRKGDQQRMRKPRYMPMLLNSRTEATVIRL